MVLAILGLLKVRIFHFLGFWKARSMADMKNLGSECNVDMSRPSDRWDMSCT